VIVAIRVTLFIPVVDKYAALHRYWERDQQLGQFADVHANLNRILYGVPVELAAVIDAENHSFSLHQSPIRNELRVASRICTTISIVVMRARPEPRHVATQPPWPSHTEFSRRRANPLGMRQCDSRRVAFMNAFRQCILLTRPPDLCTLT
jgi:hypothetical protein